MLVPSVRAAEVVIVGVVFVVVLVGIVVPGSGHDRDDRVDRVRSPQKRVSPLELACCRTERRGDGVVDRWWRC